MAGEYRKFWLINAKGERYDLADPNSNHTFFNEPQGLGFRRDYTSERIGSSEIILSQELSMLDITGEIVFWNENNARIYQDYQEFIRFISYRPLELHYQPVNVTEVDSYYANIIITNLDKSEISHEDSILRCPITMHRLSEWLTKDEIVYIFTNESDDIDHTKFYGQIEQDGTTYTGLLRNYHYKFNSLSSGATIMNDGNDEVGFTIMIQGEVSNPIFYLSQNNEIYGACGITEGPYTYIMINSVDDKESIYLEKSGPTVVANPARYQNFSSSIAGGQTYLTWCKLKVGESVFTFAPSDFDGVITISFRKSYASV